MARSRRLRDGRQQKKMMALRLHLLTAISFQWSDREWSGGGSVQEYGGVMIEADGSAVEGAEPQSYVVYCVHCVTAMRGKSTGAPQTNLPTKLGHTPDASFLQSPTCFYFTSCYNARFSGDVAFLPFRAGGGTCAFFL